MILVVDNYDSFTHNLVHAVATAGADTMVVRNDAVDLDGVAALAPEGIVLSPGPGHPANERDFGVCAGIVRRPPAPVLGVCLGMQGMAQHLGGRVAPAPVPVHGEASPMQRPDHFLFEGLPESFEVGRYHSLCVAEAPPGWTRLGRTPDGVLMAMAHRAMWGLQFHPESVLTPHGPRIIANFVEACR